MEGEDTRGGGQGGGGTEERKAGGGGQERERYEEKGCQGCLGTTTNFPTFGSQRW